MPLTLNNVLLKHGRKTIVSELSLTIFEGTICCITGANGAGKTTLIKTLAGLHPIKRGSITFDEKNINDYEEYLNAIGILTHTPGIRTELTALEHIKFWASLYDTELMAPSLIDAFNLDLTLHKQALHLSQGTRKKIAIVCMLLANKSIWLMDEPFANLDHKASDTLWKFIEAKADNGGLVLFTSHHKTDAKKAHIEINLNREK